MNSNRIKDNQDFVDSWVARSLAWLKAPEGEQDRIRNKKNNLTGYEATLGSYGTAIATVVSPTLCLVLDAREYSATTARHISLASRAAIRAGLTCIDVLTVDDTAWRRMRAGLTCIDVRTVDDTTWRRMHENNIGYFLERVVYLNAKIPRCRSERQRAVNRTVIEDVLQQARLYCGHFQIHEPKFENVEQSLVDINDVNELLRQDADVRKEAALVRWRENGEYSKELDSAKALLHIKGGMVLTSNGENLELRNAQELFQVVSVCKASEIAIRFGTPALSGGEPGTIKELLGILADTPEGTTLEYGLIAAGFYWVSRIDADGTIVVACTTVSFDEMSLVIGPTLPGKIPNEVTSVPEAAT